MIIVDVAAIILLFALFAFSHSWLASIKIKKAIAEKTGTGIAFYRLFYNLISFLFLALFYFASPRPDVILYDLHYPFDIITFAFQILSFAGLIWAARTLELMEFAGVLQVIRYFKGTYNAEDLDEKQELKIKGAYKFVRHPIYFFSILFLGVRPSMDLFYFVMFVCIAVYFYVGSFYEEKKLVEKFGDEYRNYQKKVPRIFPLRIRRSFQGGTAAKEEL